MVGYGDMMKDDDDGSTRAVDQRRTNHLQKRRKHETIFRFLSKIVEQTRKT